MRTGLDVKTDSDIAALLSGQFVKQFRPNGSVHQPSIRARIAAHDVSIRSSTIHPADRRGGAAHSIARPQRPSITAGTPALERLLGRIRRWSRSHGRGRSLHWLGRAATTPKLCVVDVITEHDVEAHEELPGEGDPGRGPSAAMQKGEVATSQILIGPGREGRGLAEHPAEERAALLGDLAQALFIGGRRDGRGQADVTDDVLAIGKARDRSEDKNGRQGRQGPDAWVGEQELGTGVVARDRRDLLIELIDAGSQPGQELQAVISPACGVRRKWVRLQLGEPRPRPQFRPECQTLTEGDRRQAVFHHGAHAHQADPMRDEGAAITRVAIRNPHGWESIVFEQVEEMPRVAPIGLRLADDHRADLGRFAHDDGVTEPMHEGVKPLRVASGLDADRHRRPQRSVESLDGVAVMGELLLEDFARRRVEDSNLLLSRVQITSDECHESGLLSGGWVTVPQPNPINRGRPFS